MRISDLIKPFETIKNDNEYRIKVFGITIYEKLVEHITVSIRQKILGGLIVTDKITSDNGNLATKTIKFCGIQIAKRIDELEKTSWFLFNIKYKEYSLQKLFEKKYLKFFDNKFDDIYILNANSGEIYLFLTYIFKAIKDRNKSKTPLFVASKKYHTELVKSIYPDIPCVYIPHFYRKIKSPVFGVKNFRFFTIFPKYYFANIEDAIKSNPAGEKHYFELMLDYFDLAKEDIKMQSITVPEDSKTSILEKVKNINLNLEKFIFLSPEAISCELLDNKYWIDLIKNYQTQGYDIFVNLTGDMVNLESAAYKTCFLTYSEAFALACRAKKIISLRSGFTEILSQTKVPMDVIYTKFKDRHHFRDMALEYVKAGFSLYKLPGIDNNIIKEISVN